VLAVRFFRVVLLHSHYMLIGLVAMALFGVSTLAMDPGSGTDATASLLLLQMFAVSSGFAVPARRGHFDLLLTGGVSRPAIAFAHWAVSVTPGMAAWIFLGVVEWILAGRPEKVLSSGTVGAFALVSTLGWAVTVPLPRLSGGVLWLASLFIAVAALGNWQETLAQVSEGRLGGPQMSVAFLVCPFLMVGNTLDPGQRIALLPGLALAGGAMAAAIVWICRMDVALEAAQ
jgi:hypothetical protein